MEASGVEVKRVIPTFVWKPNDASYYRGRCPICKTWFHIDDITFLGVALNSTTSTVDNMMNIFRKFVTTDLAQKAYREKEIRLEGSQRDLAVLFTDIRSFTYMTETLGSDIIKILNLHYDTAIHHIQLNGGVVVTVMSNFGFHQAMKEAGVEVAVTQVGDRYVIDEMGRRGWALGGEQSGHIIASDFVSTGDGIAAALMTMRELGDARLEDAVAWHQDGTLAGPPVSRR